jgi:hypothetical protein
MKYIIFVERIVYCGSILHKRSSNVNLMFSVYIKLYILMVKAKKVWLRTSLDEHMFVIGRSNSTLDFVYGWSILQIEWAITAKVRRMAKGPHKFNDTAFLNEILYFYFIWKQTNAWIEMKWRIMRRWEITIMTKTVLWWIYRVTNRVSMEKSMGQDLLKVGLNSITA